MRPRDCRLGEEVPSWVRVSNWGSQSDLRGTLYLSRTPTSKVEPSTSRVLDLTASETRSVSLSDNRDMMVRKNDKCVRQGTQTSRKDERDGPLSDG